MGKLAIFLRIVRRIRRLREPISRREVVKPKRANRMRKKVSSKLWTRKKGTKKKRDATSGSTTHEGNDRK